MFLRSAKREKIANRLLFTHLKNAVIFNVKNTIIYLYTLAKAENSFFLMRIAFRTVDFQAIGH